MHKINWQDVLGKNPAPVGGSIGSDKTWLARMRVLVFVGATMPIIVRILVEAVLVPASVMDTIVTVHMRIIGPEEYWAVIVVLFILPYLSLYHYARMYRTEGISQSKRFGILGMLIAVPVFELYLCIDVWLSEYSHESGSTRSVGLALFPIYACIVMSVSFAVGYILAKVSTWTRGS